MKTLLAKVTIQSLALAQLNALTQAWHEAKPIFTYPLVQSHHTVEGSYEERTELVSAAFRLWAKKARKALGDDDEDYYYWWSCTILAIYSDALVFYVYCNGCPKYHRVGYTIDEKGDVQIDGEIQTVDVTLIVKELGIAETGADEPSDQATEIDDDELSIDLQSVQWHEAQVSKKKQGAELAKDTTLVKEATSTSTTIEHSDDSPDPKGGKEDANSPGSTTGVAPDDITTSATIEHSDDAPAGKGDENKPSGEVKAELDDTAAGFKGSDPEHTYGDIDKPYNQATGQGNPKFLIQSGNRDKAGTSLAYIEQSKKSEDGKTLNLQGIATRADIINAEGVVYPLSVWEQNVVKMNQSCQAGKFLGKLEHPDTDLGLQGVALKFNKIWMQGSDVHFDADVVLTEQGKDLAALIDAGVQVDMSTRGYGTAKEATWRGQSVKLIQDDFVCVAVDAVWYGASTGSGVTSSQYQSTNAPVDTTMENQTQAQKDAAKLRAEVEFTQYKKDLLSTCGLNDIGYKAYAQALESATTLDGLSATSSTMLPILQGTFAKNVSAEEQTQSSTYTPRFLVTQSASETAPRTINEMFDRLVADLPDSFPGVAKTQSAPENHFRSPRAACRRLLVNMANTKVQGFDGLSAAKALVHMESSRFEEAGDVLNQALAPGATTAGGDADPGGAPLSAPLIFPLVRRVFPMYIMGEIAAVQPMDRPEGKIFYLDQFRTNSSTGANVARIDLNTSSTPFNSSYSDNSTEGSAAQLIRLQLQSITVTANTKKLGANWSIEEMQDLRAYHGLDAAQELMQGVAREIAIEWNSTVLNDMAAQATASSTSFGTVIPASGFTQQKDWDEYIWTYIQNLDNKIFSKRNGPMTHLIVGVDAALALAKSMRGTFQIGGENGGAMDEMYPGTTFFGSINTPNGSRYRVFKTNFWGSGTTYGNTMLGLRRGTEWSDTPYVWAPYTDYVTPMLTDPSDFSQKQGVVSRAANQVVVSDAMGLITVVPGQVGAVL